MTDRDMVGNIQHKCSGVVYSWQRPFVFVFATLALVYFFLARPFSFSTTASVSKKHVFSCVGGRPLEKQKKICPNCSRTIAWIVYSAMLAILKVRLLPIPAATLEPTSKSD